MYDQKQSIAKTFYKRAEILTYDVVGAALNFIFGESSVRWCVGFGPVTIQPGKTAVVSMQPQCDFAGEKIINTGDSDGLAIQGLFVGQRSQLPTFQNPIAVNTFNGTVLDNELKMTKCDPALYITFQIINNSKEPRTFSATIIGKCFIPRWWW